MKAYGILWTDGTTTEETFNTLSGLNIYLNMMQKAIFTDTPRGVPVFDPARLH